VGAQGIGEVIEVIDFLIVELHEHIAGFETRFGRRTAIADVGELDAVFDLAEVRDRLASVQEFHGYSSSAATLSGGIAVIAGAVQWIVAPHPRTPAEYAHYLTIWLVCLAGALAINYGALLIWYVRNARLHERRQTRTVGKRDMLFNDATPPVRVHHITHEVTINGQRIAMEPLRHLSLNRLYFVS
jgi:hypothetical protein